MPSYKTHSIHGELAYPNISKNVDVDLEYFKVFCMGPDILIGSDPKTFNYQHANKVREYLEYLIKYIKDNKLYNNPNVMAYLYGHIDHYILDVVTHPLIYYFTDCYNGKTRIDQHGLTEMWIDDYICKKYDKNKIFYYDMFKIKDEHLKYIINNSYKDVFGKINEFKKYNNGLGLMNLYDTLIRRNLLLIVSFLESLLNIGGITYSDDISRVIPFLNNDKSMWFDPEDGSISNETFDDLWDKSFDVLYDTIDDINRCIYQDETLNNYYINKDISYNTGIPCDYGQKKLYVKTWR